MCYEWAQIIKDVREFKDLKDDWDGLGSLAPKDCIIDASIEFAKCLQRANYGIPQRVIPTPAQTILFEWHNKDRYYEVEIISSVSAEWLIMDYANNPNHGSFHISDSGIQLFTHFDGIPHVQPIN